MRFTSLIATGELSAGHPALVPLLGAKNRRTKHVSPFVLHGENIVLRIPKVEDRVPLKSVVLKAATIAVGVGVGPPSFGTARIKLDNSFLVVRPNSRIMNMRT
jgi:hypothetical protein